MDAGTKAEAYYRQHMRPERFWLRQRFLTVVRPESGVIAKIQRQCRSPVLDAYFAITANLGAHTFYMVMLPALFWFISYSFGLNYVLVLAIGVVITGAVKDYLCLPRPASPPCYRISMSASAKREYGMPSTHTSNAVGVSLLVLEMNPFSLKARVIAAWLLITLVLGRIYTSMHGFVDIAVGAVLGVVSHYARRLVVANFAQLRLIDCVLLTVLFVGSVLVSPRPIENCPCFDDSVAFVGVVVGAVWTRKLLYVPVTHVYRESGLADAPNAVLVSLNLNAYVRAAVRYIIGVALIVAWRKFGKNVLQAIGRRLRIHPLTVRMFVYMGIAPMALTLGPLLFNLLGV